MNVSAFISAVLILIILFSTAHSSELPQGFSFQGRLLNEAGTAPLSGTVSRKKFGPLI